MREASYYTLSECSRIIAEAEAAARADRSYSLLLFNADAVEIIGSITLSNVARGPFQACILGYGVGARWQGFGLMKEALEATLAWAFGALGLHRVMANHLPYNERSARLLERLGFEREGVCARVPEDRRVLARPCAHREDSFRGLSLSRDPTNEDGGPKAAIFGIAQIKSAQALAAGRWFERRRWLPAAWSPRPCGA